MDTKELDRKVKSFSKYYRNILLNEGINDVVPKMNSYESRLREMYSSAQFAAHSVYPSMNVPFVYAVIAMCLELKDAGYTDDRMIPAVEKGMASRWNAFVGILKFIDRFPFTFPIVPCGINQIIETE